MDETTKFLTSLGVGGVLAGLIFFFYRKDVKFLLAEWKGYTGLLVNVVKENTAANMKLCQLVESLHKRMDDEAHARFTERSDGRHKAS